MERVRHAIAQISKSLSVDAYEFPDGEIRVGVTSASTLLGYAKNYFARLPKSSKKKLKGLQGEGFTQVTKSGFVQHTSERGSEVKTISTLDLSIWINYEAKNGNKTAFDLSTALLQETLEERLGYAFNRKQKTVEEKVESFQERLDRVCRETAESFTDEEWNETSGIGGGSVENASDWAKRMLTRGWQPTVFLSHKTDAELDQDIEQLRKKYED